MLVTTRMSWQEQFNMNLDERLSLDLSRGRGKSIGGDLDVDDKGSEQISKTLVAATKYIG
jgi:hypothetical protein